MAKKQLVLFEDKPLNLQQIKLPIPIKIIKHPKPTFDCFGNGEAEALKAEELAKERFEYLTRLSGARMSLDEAYFFVAKLFLEDQELRNLVTIVRNEIYLIHGNQSWGNTEELPVYGRQTIKIKRSSENDPFNYTPPSIRPRFGMIIQPNLEVYLTRTLSDQRTIGILAMDDVAMQALEQRNDLKKEYLSKGVGVLKKYDKYR